MQVTQKNLTQYTSLAAKQLFYNDAEAQQIGRLTSLLMPDSFNAVRQRLQEKGMRQGFACLFYGSPGTGKTETEPSSADSSIRLSSTAPALRP